ncbi:MAG: M23 family metallopeptidase [Caldilineaceae bacterium]|nr:M23 family metallopeptidase [Caldilineaceae bacterium]
MMKIKRIIGGAIVLAVGALAIAFYIFGPRFTASPERLARLRSWFANPAAHADWAIAAGKRCGNAVMVQPTNGYIGFGWNDSFRPGHHHSGLDIFGPDGENNVTPIVAAYDGYLTREANWKSTVIIRHPDFPSRDELGIAPGAQIWTYYTHMASADGAVSYVAAEFPPGTYEVFVKAGTLLGRQGNWSGSRFGFTGRHLHFSIVKSNADGSYLDERVLENTFDPAPFLSLTRANDGIFKCSPAVNDEN